MIRRRLLSLGAAAVAGTVTGPAVLRPAYAQGARATKVLVHGAWHGAWCWSSVVDRLAAAGAQTLALDLPGHGIGAAFPEGYFDQPQDPVRLAAAPSPLAALDAEAYRMHVTRAIESLVRSGSGPVVLVVNQLRTGPLAGLAASR